MASQNRVTKQRQGLQLKAKQVQKFQVTTNSQHNNPVAPNVLEQTFVSHRPSESHVLEKKAGILILKAKKAFQSIDIQGFIYDGQERRNTEPFTTGKCRRIISSFRRME